MRLPETGTRCEHGQSENTLGPAVTSFERSGVFQQRRCESGVSTRGDIDDPALALSRLPTRTVHTIDEAVSTRGPASPPVWMATILAAAFLGVALGTAAPGGAAGVARARPPAPSAQRSVAPRPVRATPAAAEWMEMREPGRSYVPLRADEPELGPAPDFLVAASAGAPAPDAEVPVVAAEPVRAHAARRSPAALTGPATGLPLLAVRRGSGRIVFHEIDAGGTAGAGLEGEWAIAGRCGERLRLDLAQPARGAGAPRGVGADLSSSGGWRMAVAVPPRECAAGRILLPRRPTAADRERFAPFSSDELQQVVATERAAWLVFAGQGQSRSTVLLRRGGAWREAWSRDADGVQEISAVLRRGDGWEGLFVTLRGDYPDTFQRIRVTGGGVHADAPASLRG